jgi:protein subunit release factor B
MNFGVTDKKLQILKDRMAALNIREQDLTEKFIRSSGPGGQKVNKTASCVLLAHAPSGIQIKMQKERSQGLNRYHARKRLCELLEQQRLKDKSPTALKNEKIRKQKQRRKRRSKNSR